MLLKLTEVILYAHIHSFMPAFTHLDN